MAEATISSAMAWPRDHADYLAWWAVLICLLFSARVATGFLTHHPRLFTVMALMACVWTQVLGYYSYPRGELSDLITDLASFLLVYIGGLLVLDTSDGKGSSHHVVPLQMLALSMLLIIAVPRAVDFNYSRGVKLCGVDTDVKHVVSAVLNVIGFISIGIGTWRISRPKAFGLFALIAIAYGALEVRYNTRCFWETCATDENMTPDYKLIFGLLKLAFTFVFGTIVAYHGMTETVRGNGIGYWVLQFFYLAPAPQIAASKPSSPAGPQAPT